mmetsp:Transcript_10098/g.15304  ORF Transcript_10098/g.15304 Transcript_10098/m.15304 type:complete len:189 (+) Transcript_10098:80-646(+)
MVESFFDEVYPTAHSMTPVALVILCSALCGAMLIKLAHISFQRPHEEHDIRLILTRAQRLLLCYDTLVSNNILHANANSLPTLIERCEELLKASGRRKERIQCLCDEINMLEKDLQLSLSMQLAIRQSRLQATIEATNSRLQQLATSLRSKSPYTSMNTQILEADGDEDDATINSYLVNRYIEQQISS